MGIPPTQHGEPQPETPAAGDPSMEDILASIRRILNEDEAGGGGAPAAEGPGAKPAETPPGESDVLVLDQSMMVNPQEQRTLSAPMPEPIVHEPPPAAAAPPVIAMAPPSAPPPSRLSELLAPESEAAAVSSVGALLRTLTAERSTQVHRGGPTIEDLVREELRPLLKSWLDTHLPPLVERLVRAEIERVAGRAG